jgi:hypothetical protein
VETCAKASRRLCCVHPRNISNANSPVALHSIHLSRTFPPPPRSLTISRAMFSGLRSLRVVRFCCPLLACCSCCAFVGLSRSGRKRKTATIEPMGVEGLRGWEGGGGAGELVVSCLQFSVAMPHPRAGPTPPGRVMHDSRRRHCRRPHHGRVLPRRGP